MKPATLALVLLAVAAPALADDKPADPWGAWIERDFPFFSTVVDARAPGNTDNLVPRGIVFQFGDHYACWDMDLLRVAAVWSTAGPPLRGAGMAVHTYPDKLQKVGPGQKGAPKPTGDVWVRNGAYPGVSLGQPTLSDPRTPHPQSPDEVGRGGLPSELGAFRGIHRDGTLEYRVGNVPIRERLSASNEGVTRTLTIDPHDRPLWFVLARGDADLRVEPAGGLVKRDDHQLLRIDPARSTQTVRVTYARKLTGVAAPKQRDWTKRVTVDIPAFEPPDGAPAAIETIPLPRDNPWDRGVRVAGVDFLTDGSAVIVTYDGDVWIGDRLAPGTRSIAWRRFASGLHEPLSVGVHRDAVHVFDRNGIWRLRDTDADGAADVHELVCGSFDQTAETREFASDMRIAPDGSFVICKPGQTSSSVARSSGAVLRVSPDGSTVTRLATGLRQPFLGLDDKTGRIAVSDQQGNYVPTTPVHIVEPGAFYGFMGRKGPYPKPITPPLTWIPHHVCGSAASLHWLRGKPFGPLDEACVLLAFTEPGMLQVYTDESGGVRQGAASRIPLGIGFAPLKGATNPADGMFYLAGFKIWGTRAQGLTALARLHINPDHAWPLPSRVIAARRGVLLSFNHELDAEHALDRARYTIERWNYQRTPAYGSPHFKLDGSKGKDALPVSEVKLSKDRRSVFIGVPRMLEAMQIGVGYDVQTAGGKPIKHEAFITAHKLRTLDLKKHGFADNDVDLTGGVVAQKTEKPSVDIGRQVYNTYGCAACHSLDGGIEGKTGPSWKGLFGSERKLVGGGKTIRADAAYLRESIVDPTAKVAEGAVNGEAGMPAYAGVLSEAQIESVLMLIRSLGDEEQPLKKKKPTD